MRKKVGKVGYIFCNYQLLALGCGSKIKGVIYASKMIESEETWNRTHLHKLVKNSI